MMRTLLSDEYIVISNHKFASIFQQWAGQKSEKITVLDDGTTSNETRLGAVKDIQFAIEQLHLDNDILVMAGDNLLDFSLGGFIHYAKEHQIDYEDYTLLSSYTREDGYTMVNTLIQKGTLPTALVCASDPIAIGALRALNEHHIKTQ